MKDISGKHFGKLTAVFPTSITKKGVVFWLCECDCGNTKIIRYGGLISGNPNHKSCGCSQYHVGPTHHNWKGDNATYEPLHDRLEIRRGKPKRCDVCGTTDTQRRYDWANLTGRYFDPTDFKRMCRSCHTKFDISKKRGHGNVYKVIHKAQG